MHQPQDKNPREESKTNKKLKPGFRIQIMSQLPLQHGDEF